MDSEPVTPFSEHCQIGKLAGDFGFSVAARDHIEVTDEDLLVAAGLMCLVPDYVRIRKLLRDGREVPGARLMGVEYILQRKR